MGDPATLRRRMPSGPRRLRPWRPSGLYRNKALTPQQQQTAGTLRDQLAADLGQDPSAAQRILLDLVAIAKVKHADAAHYLMSLPRPWVDKRSRSVWRIVHDTSKLERHVARLVQALVDPALERRPQPVETLADYAARVTAEPQTPDEDGPGSSGDGPRSSAEAMRSEVAPAGDDSPGNGP